MEPERDRQKDFTAASRLIGDRYTCGTTPGSRTGCADRDHERLGTAGARREPAP